MRIILVLYLLVIVAFASQAQSKLARDQFFSIVEDSFQCVNANSHFCESLHPPFDQQRISIDIKIAKCLMGYINSFDSLDNSFKNFQVFNDSGISYGRSYPPLDTNPDHGRYELNENGLSDSSISFWGGNLIYTLYYYNNCLEVLIYHLESRKNRNNNISIECQTVYEELEIFTNPYYFLTYIRPLLKSLDDQFTYNIDGPRYLLTAQRMRVTNRNEKQKLKDNDETIHYHWDKE